LCALFFWGEMGIGGFPMGKRVSEVFFFFEGAAARAFRWVLGVPRPGGWVWRMSRESSQVFSFFPLRGFGPEIRYQPRVPFFLFFFLFVGRAESRGERDALLFFSSFRSGIEFFPAEVRGIPCNIR